MFVKICGIRDVATAETIFALRPDAIGLNFYEPSVRYVSPETAREICEACPPAVEPIGVFVNHTAVQIDDICELTGIRCVQLHGDEMLSEYRLLAEKQYQVILAWRLMPEDESMHDLTIRYDEALAAGLEVRALLVDAGAPGQYGGTGETLRWDVVGREYDRSRFPWLILAGGLHPENVGEAIDQARPWGVDVASGVESSRGVKDVERCRHFLINAKHIGR